MPLDSVSIAVVASLASVAITGIGIEHRRHRAARRALTRALALGLEDPPTIYPRIDPPLCIGCGSCVNACPEHVFGTAKRCVLVPLLGEDLQSSVPGIYVAGELGGFGLIRTAVDQGVRVVSQFNASPGRQNGSVDVAIVGAGPAGIGAALACRERGLSHTVLDQDGLCGSVLHYSRRKRS